MLCNFVEITLQYGYSPVNLLQFSKQLFLRTPLSGCFWSFQTVKVIISLGQSENAKLAVIWIINTIRSRPNLGFDLTYFSFFLLQILYV